MPAVRWNQQVAGEKERELATAAVSQGIAGVFVECHPNPAEALCDGPCATSLGEMEALMTHLFRLDEYIKGLSR